MTHHNDEKLITHITIGGIIRFSILFLVLLCFVVLADRVLTNKDISCEIQNIDDGWTACLGKEKSENITISQTRFSMQNKGDILTFSRMLEDDIAIPNPVLCLYSIHSEVNVYLDGKIIFSTKAENKLEELLPGYGVNLVELPENYQGKKLDVHYFVKENGSFEGLQAPVIMDGAKRTAYLFSQNRIGYLIVLTLSLIGVIMIAISIVMSIRNPIFIRVFFIGGFSFLSGCWCMCNNEMLQLFIINVSYKSYVEYITFFLMVIPFILYFWDRVFRPEIGKRLKICYGVLLSVLLSFFALTQICHFTGIAHYPRFVLVEHVMLVFIFAFFIMLAIEGRRVYRKTEWLIISGFGAAIVIALSEMIRFNIEKYFSGFSGNKFISSLELAIFAVVVTLGVDFATKIHGALYRDTRNKLLTEMAYVDDLTGLSNRRRFTESVEEIKKADYTYSLVSLDMNLLKMMNDTYGHQVGDRALKELAEVLKLSFSDDAIICRMGGDEFEIIVPYGDKYLTERCIMNMEHELEKRNSISGNKVTLSVAYGVAYKFEKATYEEVFKLADERMYACKEKQHMQRNG